MIVSLTFAVGDVRVPLAVNTHERPTEPSTGKSISMMASVDGHYPVHISMNPHFRVCEYVRSKALLNGRLAGLVCDQIQHVRIENGLVKQDFRADECNTS